MARVAGPRLRTALFAAALLPLWASYLARMCAWLLILNRDGALNCRTPRSLVEASMDLGADRWRTFRRVTMPLTSTALVSGAPRQGVRAVVAEVIVTTFTAGARDITGGGSVGRGGKAAA